MCRSLVVAFLGSLLVLMSEPARSAPSDLRIEPFAFRLADGTELAAERGTFSVPEDRGNPDARRIEIGFVRFKSTNPSPGRPIVYLAGGPGGSGVQTARGPRQGVFLALRAVADVIALDQRGVGLSNHVPECEAPGLDPASGLSEAVLTDHYRFTLQHCLAFWRAAGVAVEGYTTEESADDIEDLRAALGVPQIDLWAISYGTHLAMAAMRRHPDSIGRVAFASVEGMDQTVKRPAHVDAAFARIDRAIGGGLVERMRRVHTRLDSGPATFTVREDGRETSFRSDSFAIRMLAGYLAKNPDGYPGLASFYAALEAGVSDPIAPLLQQFFLVRPMKMSGMPELMDLASGISDARLALVRAEAEDSLLGLAVNFPMPQLRGAVPAVDLGDAFREEIRSDHPTLLFEGELDVRTPLEEQVEALAGFSRLHRIRVRNGGHDLFEAHPGVPSILVNFFSGRPVEVRELALPSPGAGSN